MVQAIAVKELHQVTLPQEVEVVALIPVTWSIRKGEDRKILMVDKVLHNRWHQPPIPSSETKLLSDPKRLVTLTQFQRIREPDDQGKDLWGEAR